MSALKDYSVKNVKTFEGHDGTGFNATLYRGKKKIAKIIDTAHGGEYEYQWEDYTNRVEVQSRHYDGKMYSHLATVEEGLLQEVINELPKYKGYDIYPSMDCVVSNLVDSCELNKTLKKKCKKQTLFLIEGDNINDGYRSTNSPYSDRVKLFLDGKYGTSIKEIINERYL